MTKRTTIRRRGENITDAERAQIQDTFIAEYAKCGVMNTACQIAGISRWTIDNWRRDNPAFAARFDEAREEADDVVRAEIQRRAITGWSEPVYQQGRKVGTITRYSDRILELMAKARLPEYKERLDVTTNGQPLGPQFQVIISDPQLSELAAQLLDRSTVDSLDTSGTGPDSQRQIPSPTAYLAAGPEAD